MSRALRFWAAILPSFLAVAAIAVQAELTLRHGAEVRLEVRPYDPMDALSGRYLAVPLAIARLSLDELPSEREELQTGDVVWVRLEEDLPWWRPAAILVSPPEDDAVALRGVVESAHGRALWVDFSLERYFIPHDGADPTLTPVGGGQPGVEARETPKLVALVRVARDGRGVLADLLVDGEPYARWNARQPRAPTNR